MIIVSSIFIFGLFIGSFLNVLSDRLPKGENFLNSRSYCPSCKHNLSFFDLIPVISFIVLKGKCRYCKKRISFWYPLSEITTAVVFVLAYLTSLQSFMSIYFIFLLLISSLLIIVFLTDIKYGIILDKIITFAVFIAVLYLIIFENSSIISHFIAGLLALLFFLLLVVFTKGKGMGFGDVKLSFFMGLLLGIPGVIISLYIAFLTGAFVAIILILWRKKRFFKDTISFGPFLVLGTLITLFWGSLLNPLLLKLIGF